MANAEYSFDCDVNQFPSLTWNHLAINRGHLAAVAGGGASFQQTALPDGVRLEQRPLAGLPEELLSLRTGMGQAFDAQFDGAMEGIPVSVYTVSESAKPDSSVRLSLDSAAGVSDIVIYAQPGSESRFIIEYAGGSGGTVGSRIRILAREGARVSVAVVNLLDARTVHFDSIGADLQDGAKVELTELQLGGSKVYSGSLYGLSGAASSFEGRLAYLVDGERSLDVNYVARQTGRESSSSMKVDGVVSGKGAKTWRGTIDFVKGAVDSKGDEQENVLLMSPTAVNKSLPVILCDEEAVDGRHGSSIGRIGSDVLFYMQSRGIDELSAKKIMVKSKIASVSRFIQDADLVGKIDRHIEGAFA